MPDEIDGVEWGAVSGSLGGDSLGVECGVRSADLVGETEWRAAPGGVEAAGGWVVESGETLAVDVEDVTVGRGRSGRSGGGGEQRG